jgi:Zn-dependent protease with chaperone function
VLFANTHVSFFLSSFFTFQGLCGSKRIVIYDTLIKDLKEDVPAICAVVGHEIGHSIMHHTYILLLVTQVRHYIHRREKEGGGGGGKRK